MNEGELPLTVRLTVLDDRDDQGRAAKSIRTAVGSSAAVLYAGPGQVLTGLRPELEPRDVPVVLFEGDLYTTRGLYEEVFQASYPVLWQARVIARYLAVRGRRTVTPLYPEDDPDASRLAWRSAAEEEGIAESRGEPALPPEFPFVVFDDPRLQGLPLTGRTPEIVGTHRLLAIAPADIGAGRAAVGPYTWSGWAEPIPRVGRFREAFRRAYGGLPRSVEQQGYDAVRVLADALAETGGETGGPLIRELETVKDRAYSSLPLRFGPDDRTFYDPYQLGVFAVAGPNEEIERWLSDGVPWRPVMRTFTSDGERTTILDRDKKTFFPFWHDKMPSPKYWRSRFGILSRPLDPLH